MRDQGWYSCQVGAGAGDTQPDPVPPPGQHDAAPRAPHVPGGHPAQDRHHGAAGEVHREGLHHQPHLHHSGEYLDILVDITVDPTQAGPLNLNPSFVFWNYNGKIITYDRERGGTVGDYS